MPRMQKSCRVCKTIKDLGDFYGSISNRDGRDSRCKSCHNALSRLRHRTNYDPLKAKIKAEQRKLRGSSIENFKRQAAKYPEKYKARYQLRNAIKLGQVQRLPCEICKAEKTEAHHEDYSKPLVVRWLCKIHHVEEHHKIKDNQRLDLTIKAVRGEKNER